MTTNPMSTRASGSAGFTLIELLVVIVITGILSVLVLPSLFAWTTRAQTAEALTVMGAVRKSQAILWTESATYVSAGAVAEGSQPQVESGNSQGIVQEDACSGAGLDGLAKLETTSVQMCRRWKIATRPTADSSQIRAAVEGREDTPAKRLGVYFDGTLTSKTLTADLDTSR